MVGRRLRNLLRLRMVSFLTLVAIGLIVAGQVLNWSIPDWTATPDSVRTTGWVNTDALNVRAAPSTDAEILDVFSGGTVVSILGETRGGFLPVAYGGDRAWVFAEYVASDERHTVSLDVPVEEARAAAAEPDNPAMITGPVTGSDNTRSSAPDVAEPDIPTGEHWIDVDRGTATITLYIGDQPQAAFQGKIGWDPADDGFYSTAVGTFHVYTMNPGLSSTPYVENVYMTEFVGFDPERHNGFHSPIRDANGVILPSQNATTLGCVRLSEADAKHVYAFAFLGMRVEVHD